MKWLIKKERFLNRFKMKLKEDSGFLTTEVLLFIGIVVVISVAAWTFRDAIVALFGRGTTEVNKFIQ